MSRRRRVRRFWERVSVWLIGPYVPPTQPEIDRLIVDWAVGSRREDKASVEEWGRPG